VWEGDVIEAGPFAEKTLGEAAAEYGDALLGVKTTSRTGTRFPLLIKLLDCAQWLSLQVHPDDQLAVELALCDYNDETGRANNLVSRAQE
jgi:mannose-6-phosphate isomerase